MDREEVLLKAQNAHGLDERERSVYGNAFGFGGIVVALLCIAFSVVAAIRAQRFYEFGVILFGYQSATQFYQYSKLKQKNYLIGAVACLVASLAGVAAYLLLEP